MNYLYLGDCLDVLRNNIPDDSIGIVALKDFNILTRTMVKNSGNSIGKIIFLAGMDTSSDSPILRNILKNEFKDLNIITDYFTPEIKTELLPGDTTILDYRLSIMLKDSINFFTFHLIILYENELGQLYDTYIWGKFENIPTLYEPIYEYDMMSNKILARLKVIDDPNSRLRCKIAQAYNYTYSFEETERINAFLRTKQGE